MSPTPASDNQPAKPGTRPVGFRAGDARKPHGQSRSSETEPRTPLHSSPGSSPSSASATVATNARNAPPMKKRAKGSGFVGLLLLIAFGTAGYLLWTTLLQYEAYGVIEGRLISVSAPWDGTVTSWLVRDGDEVKQGQVLAEISNMDMEHELAAYGDELKMSQALLDAEISKVKFDVQSQSDRSQKAVAEYLKAYGELLAETAKLQELDRKLLRTKQLLGSRNVSRSEYEQVFFQFDGQKKKVEKLEDAVEVLKNRSADGRLAQNDGASQLKPILAQIELAQSKISRLRQRIDQGKIKAPVSGRISNRYCLTGESTKSGDTVIEILEDNSIEAVLYLPQRIVDEFSVGHEMEITLEPHHQPLRCTIVRFGGRFENAPESIEGFYYENQPLLPVYMKPGPEAGPLMEIRVGGTVKRPYEYRKALAKMMDEAKSAWNQWTEPPHQQSAAARNSQPPGKEVVNEEVVNEEVVNENSPSTDKLAAQPVVSNGTIYIDDEQDNRSPDNLSDLSSIPGF